MLCYKSDPRTVVFSPPLSHLFFSVTYKLCLFLYLEVKVMPRLILLMGVLLVSSHQAFGDFVFRENFDGYREGSKAHENIKEADKSAAPVIWAAEANTKIV